MLLAMTIVVMISIVVKMVSVFGRTVDYINECIPDDDDSRAMFVLCFAVIFAI